MWWEWMWIPLYKTENNFNSVWELLKDINNLTVHPVDCYRLQAFLLRIETMILQELESRWCNSWGGKGIPVFRMMNFLQHCQMSAFVDSWHTLVVVVVLISLLVLSWKQEEEARFDCKQLGLLHVLWLAWGRVHLLIDCHTFLATSVVMGVGFTSPIDTPTLHEVHHSEG
jgi:hypothetical protein